MSALNNRMKPSTSISPLSTPPMMIPSPFAFPFSPLGLGMNLFDNVSNSRAGHSNNMNSPIDPNHILHLLHQQSLLAEELLKYRTLLGIPSTSKINPYLDNNMSIKPSIELFKVSSNNQYKQLNHKDRIRDDLSSPSPHKQSKPVQPSSTSEIDLTKDDPRSGTSTPLIKARPESDLLPEKTTTTISAAAVSAMLIDPEELKCHICMANFPSLWLLEQHTALQHSQLSCSEKPYKCEHCGQNYRYNCCFQSSLINTQQDHTNSNNRARIPADKLFTCDVCGMQFRYLKSFKKHRLNHALERLHGKKDLNTGENSGELMVSSTNDNENGTAMAKGIISLEDEQMLLDDQDDTIDSISNNNSNINNSNNINFNINQNDPNRSISSDNTGGDITDKLNSSAINECDKQVTSGNITSSENVNQHEQMNEMQQDHDEAESTNSVPVNFSMSNMNNSFHMQNASTALKSLLNAETITNQTLMGLNSQEVSILNFLRVDAAEKQRDKRFACPFCGKCVRSKENLKLHVRKHTGERPFVCLFCGRAFGGKSDLTRHLRIHTGERPYHCESCGKCFARADYLSKHLTTHVHNTQQQQQR